MMRTAYNVAAINPFWRYAVALDHRPDLPAVPYWSKARALAFYDESRAAFPDRTTVLLRRRWPHRAVEVVASERNGVVSMPAEGPTREELLRFVAEATEYAGSFAAQMGATMPWTDTRKARSARVYEQGSDLLRRAAASSEEGPGA